MRTLLLGATGLVGSALNEVFAEGYDVIPVSHEKLEIFDYQNLIKLISDVKPELILNAAGRVAGIKGQIEKPADLISSNALISLNVARAANELGINRLIQFASACVYPIDLPRPATPIDIGSGVIELTSKSYAIAKILGIEIFSAYNKQYGRNWKTIIPSNIYGPRDWVHGEAGHVIGMLSEKFYLASKNKINEVVIWGDGTALRNFLHVSDLALATKFVVESSIDDEIINVSSKEEISISQLATEIKSISGFQGYIKYDVHAPSGAKRKTIDDSTLRALGWKDVINLSQGLDQYYRKFEEFFG